MNDKKIKQRYQEEEYQFPYHYLLDYDDSAIDIVKRYNYGFVHYTITWLIKRILSQIKPKSLLDVGCGDGKLIYEILNNNNLQVSIKDVIGIDTDNRAIEFAKIFNSTNNAQFISGDIHQYTHEPFDLIILTEVIEHMDDQNAAEFLKKIHSLIASDKHFIITVPSLNIPLQSKHYKHYDKSSLEALLKDLFIIEKLFYIDSTKLYLKAIKQIYMLLDDFKLQRLKKIVFSYYKKKFMLTSEKTCQHIMVLCRKS